MTARDPLTPNSISVTYDGLTIWNNGKPVYKCPVDRFPKLIARLARQLEINLADRTPTKRGGNGT